MLHGSADSRSQMPAGESESRTRLEVPLECERALLVPERDDDINAPWPAVRRVRTTAGIVRCETCVNVGGHTRVITGRHSVTLENVDEALGSRHMASK